MGARSRRRPPHPEMTALLNVTLQRLGSQASHPTEMESSSWERGLLSAGEPERAAPLRAPVSSITAQPSWLPFVAIPT